MSLGGGSRQGSDSRCCRPEGGPYSWVDFVNNDCEAVQEFAAWLATLPRFERLDAIARIDALNELASRGEIVVSGDDSDQLKVVASDPDMYELRWTILTRLVRQYHAEPARHPRHLIRLHLHIKADVTQRWSPTRSQQDEIEYARDRYRRTSA